MARLLNLIFWPFYILFGGYPSSVMGFEASRSVCNYFNMPLFVNRLKSPQLRLCSYDILNFLWNMREKASCWVIQSSNSPLREPSGTSMSSWLTGLELAWLTSVSLEARGEIREALEELVTTRRPPLFPLFFQPIRTHFNLALTNVIQ